MNQQQPCRSAERGITLIEALIALVVVGFGFVTLAGFGLGLSRHADAARQRTEATRLAEEKLERFRGDQAYADLASGSDAPALAGNTSYARAWRVTPGTADLLRLVTVTVSWTDRAGAADGLTLQTIVARADPADIGSVALPPPGNAPWRRTRDRSLDIPFEAAQLGGANRGRSTLGWTAGSALVFDDAAGTATALCSAPVADTTDLASTCIALQGLLLEGYIDGDLPAAPPALGFDRLQHVLAGTTPECVVLPAADQNSGASIGDRLRYRCLIQPGDHDADPATPRVWSGRLRFAGLAAGSTVCRYARAADTTVNAEHAETYTLVAQSLSQQNYAISASGSCPGGSVPQQAA